MIFVREESTNEQCHNTMKHLLQSTVSQKDEKPQNAGLDDTAIPHIKIKITEIPRGKMFNTTILYTPMSLSTEFWSFTNDMSLKRPRSNFWMDKLKQILW